MGSSQLGVGLGEVQGYNPSFGQMFHIFMQFLANVVQIIGTANGSISEQFV